jgi:hypothetical protein
VQSVRLRPLPFALFVAVAVLLPALVGAGPVAAQDTPPAGDEPIREEPDATRLDVERLPPEAIEIERELYAHGLFVEGWVGGRGFVTGVGRYSDLGAYANVGVGYELFPFLWLRGAFEASFHESNGPAPPTASTFELLGVIAEVRLQIDFSPFVAMWLQGEGGLVLAFGDILRAYGFTQAESIGLTYGGSLGFDWHMKNRHTSLGLAGGARLYPSLETFDGEQTLGVHGAAYIRYVF